MQFKRKIDEGSIKSKFENSSSILYDILSIQRPSSDMFGLGFVKEKKPENFPITNKKGGKKSYAKILKTPAKKEVNKKAGLISQDENRNNIAPKRPNRYLQIFLGYCYSCNNFGHKALNCRTKRKESEYKKMPSSIKTKGNKNIFLLLQQYDIECYKCNNHGHMARDCKLKLLQGILMQLSLRVPSKRNIREKRKNMKVP